MAAGNGAPLATGWLELTVSTAGAQKQITDSIVPGATKAGGDAGSGFGAELLGGIKKFAAPIAAAVAGFAVGKFIADSQTAFMDLVAATNQLQRIAGGTKEEVSGLRGALQLSGVDTDKATASMTIFSRKLGDAAGDASKAAEMQAKLGTSFQDATGAVKPLSDVLPGLADKFKSMPDGAEKTALAVELFGRSGTTMLPFLNKGSAGIAELTAKAKEMGLVVDDVAAKTFAAAKVSMREYDASVQGLKVTLGGELVPVVTAVQNVFRSVMIPVIQAVTAFLSSQRDEFLAVAGAIQSFADKVRTAVSGVIEFFQGGTTFDLGMALGVGQASAVLDVFETVRSTVSAVASGLAESFGGVFAALGPVFAQLGPVFAGLLPQLAQLWSSFSPVSLILNSLLPVLPQLAQVFGDLAATLGGALGTVLTAILPVISDLVGTLTGTLSGVLQSVLPSIMQLAQVLGDTLGQALVVIAPIIGQLAQSLGGALNTAIQAIAPVLGQIVSALAGALAQALPMIVPLIEMAATYFGSLLTALMPLIPSILDLITPILSLVTPLIDLVGAILPPLIQLFMALATPMTQLVPILVDLLVPVLQFLIGVLAGLIGWVVDVITWFVALLTGQTDFAAGFGKVWDGIVAFFTGIGKSISRIWDGLVKSIGDGINGVIEFFTGLPKRILDTLSGAATWLVDIGKNMIQGLLDGASSLLKNIGTFFLKIIPSWIVEPFKAALGIRSPSRVFHAFGVNTAEGYMGGLEASREAVSATLAGLVGVPSIGAGLSVSAAGTGSTFNVYPQSADVNAIALEVARVLKFGG